MGQDCVLWVVFSSEHIINVFEHLSVLWPDQPGLEIIITERGCQGGLSAGCAPQGRRVEQLLESRFPVYSLPEAMW